MFSTNFLKDPTVFRATTENKFDQYLQRQANRFDPENCLKIDLHCHDFNSDVPDELWGRILCLPETWLKTDSLVKLLRNNGCDLVTVTNHNNARSCWELLDKGEDVLVGAEFTCFFPEYDLFVHILTYGFTPEQEVVLNKKRENIYEFLRYSHLQNLPVILPHPLYFYTRNDKIDLSLFEKLAVLFQRFEVMNGQRDQWQSLLTLRWAESLDVEKITGYSKKHGLNPEDFGVDPEKPKILTGGSDDHMGIFAGESGSNLYIPNLEQQLKIKSKSDLALEAIRQGNISPYGDLAENQKLNIAILDYFSQVATKMEDPGLLRILFHRGETSDKLACFAISNLMLEMKKHKNAQKFFGFIHKALHGKKPNKLIKWKVNKDYRFCIDQLEKIADSKLKSPQEFISTVNQAIPELFHHLNLLIIRRFKDSFKNHKSARMANFSSQEITKKFEVPSQLSSLFFGGSTSTSSISGLNVGTLLDNLTFPMLVSVILLGTTIGSTRLLYQNRKFLNDFAEHIKSARHPKKALYLTDTLLDKNGVSNSLSGKLRHIQEKELAIDFLICHESAEAQSHLHVVRPLETFSFAEFGEQEFRVPDILQILRIFYEGGYDRIICSTEGPMAIVSLAIKHMFNVPCYFFMHTDWLEFIKQTTDLSQHERDRFRRLLRFFYNQYTGVFVLNSDHKDWLTGYEMQLPAEKVMLTAHHVEPQVRKIDVIAKAELFSDANQSTPILLFAGRISKEKGISDLVKVFEQVKQTLPELKLVVAGQGPDEKELKQALPDALFTGWISKEKLRQLYMSLDLKVFPTRFDTFGNVILEAFCCGMPVISYNCKGPKIIIQDQQNGFLVEDIDAMSQQIIKYFSNREKYSWYKENALKRAMEYQAEPIMSRFLEDLGLDYPKESLVSTLQTDKVVDDVQRDNEQSNNTFELNQQAFDQQSPIIDPPREVSNV